MFQAPPLTDASRVPPSRRPSTAAPGTPFPRQLPGRPLQRVHRRRVQRSARRRSRCAAARWADDRSGRRPRLRQQQHPAALHEGDDDSTQSPAGTWIRYSLVASCRPRRRRPSTSSPSQPSGWSTRAVPPASPAAPRCKRAPCGLPARRPLRGARRRQAETDPGHVAAFVFYAANQPTPPTSTLNYGPGQTRANNAVTALASDSSGLVAVRLGFERHGAAHHRRGGLLSVSGAEPCRRARGGGEYPLAGDRRRYLGPRPQRPPIAGTSRGDLGLAGPGAKLWPSWYPNSHRVRIVNGPRPERALGRASAGGLSAWRSTPRSRNSSVRTAGLDGAGRRRARLSRVAAVPCWRRLPRAYRRDAAGQPASAAW